MSGWTAKRFWTDATVEQTPEGFVVRLDGRDIRTPGKAPLIMPTRALAEAVREEWAMQGDKIDPTTMPVTRTVNSAIDKVAAQRNEVVELIAAYGDADLMCYRATSPVELVRRQSEAWDPLLDWAAETPGRATGSAPRCDAPAAGQRRPEPPCRAGERVLRYRACGLS